MDTEVSSLPGHMKRGMESERFLLRLKRPANRAGHPTGMATLVSQKQGFLRRGVNRCAHVLGLRAVAKLNRRSVGALNQRLNAIPRFQVRHGKRISPSPCDHVVLEA